MSLKDVKSVTESLAGLTLQNKECPKINLVRTLLPDGKSWFDQCHLLPDELHMDSKEFDRLFKTHPAEHGKVFVYGKLRDVPRWQKTYGADYKFSNVDHKADILTDPFLLKLQDWVRQHAGIAYQQCLVNWYQDGNHCIGAHSDDEKQLVEDSAIYSFSFSEDDRDFIITSKKGAYRRVIQMMNNTLIIMGGEMQKHYKHEVPTRKKVTGRRINVTFRLFK